jgi:hypothetical protein
MKFKPQASNVVVFNLRETIFRGTESGKYMITALNVGMDEVATRYPLSSLDYGPLDNLYFAVMSYPSA